MLKKSFFLSLVFLLSGMLYGQNEKVSITIGPPYRVVDAPSKLYFYDNNEIMSIKLVKDMIIIQKFTSDLKFVQQREYRDLPKHALTQRIGKHNDKYYLFYSLKDKGNGNEQLFCREIDFAKGLLGKESIELIAVTSEVSGIFDFHYSKDKSKLLIKYRLKPEKKNDSKSYDIIGMHVFDHSLAKLWDKEVTMPYTEKKMNNIDYAIDSDGNSYILAMVYNDETTDIKKSKKDESPNYHIELLRIKANSDAIEKKSIELRDKFINDIALFETSEDYMICAGFYNNGFFRKNANGIFAFKIKKDGDVYDMTHHEIPLELINQNADNKTIRKNLKADDAEYQRLYFDLVVTNPDGSILLVGEQYYMREHYSTDSKGRTRVRYSYHYDDILLTKLGKDGNLEWMNKIPKRQSGPGGTGSMSYNHFNYNKNHFFVILDNEKNEKLSSDQTPAIIGNGGTGQLTAYKVGDDTGTIERISLLNTAKVKGIPVYQLTPTRIMQSGENEFIVEVYKKKKEDVLIKLKL